MRNVMRTDTTATQRLVNQAKMWRCYSIRNCDRFAGPPSLVQTFRNSKWQVSLHYQRRQRIIQHLLEYGTEVTSCHCLDTRLWSAWFCLEGKRQRKKQGWDYRNKDTSHTAYEEVKPRSSKTTISVNFASKTKFLWVTTDMYLGWLF
jgi:hypothetical protein